LSIFGTRSRSQIEISRLATGNLSFSKENSCCTTAIFTFSNSNDLIGNSNIPLLIFFYSVASGKMLEQFFNNHLGVEKFPFQTLFARTVKQKNIPYL
jgi:hypothetical protein